MISFANPHTIFGGQGPLWIVRDLAYKLHADQRKRRFETDDPQERLRIDEEMSKTREYMDRLDMARLVGGLSRW